MTNALSRRSLIKAGIAGGTAIAAASASAATGAGIYKPGTYSSKAEGIGGDVIVRMTFSASRITGVEFDASHETPSIGQQAAKTLREAIMKAQGAGIQAVSGASVTSGAVMTAAKKCIAQAKGEAPVEVITKKAAEPEAKSPAAGPADWLGKEPEIAEKDITATKTADIVVVGCGTGGLFAVCAAAESGADVIGIDRFSTGTGIRDDLAAIDSRYQKAWGTKIDKLEYVTMATEYAAGHIDQRLVKLFCDKSAETINWYGDRLAERGVKLWHESGDKGDKTRYKHFATGHSPDWSKSDDGTGKKLDGNKVLHDYAVKKGAKFDYGMRMVKLEKKGGRVTGCIAKASDGKFVRYNARKGVVVATGGYARNYQMLEALQPWNLRISGYSSAMPGAMGDGIRACLWAGAKKDETASLMMFDRAALRPDQNPGVETVKSGNTALFWPGSQPWLKVNADGERFFNESGTYEGILHADEYQKGHAHYCIFDSNWGKYAKQFKMHGCSRLFNFENGAAPNLRYEMIRDKVMPKLIKDGFMQVANSIDELAKKLGIPADALKATVAHYNKLAYAKKDTDFGKEPHRLTPVDKPPFYGVKTCARILCTMDGIQINTKGQAIDTNGNPIPGLYVVGNDSGCYFANTYPNLSTGMACGRTVTFGRLVGKHLAKI